MPLPRPGEPLNVDLSGKVVLVTGATGGFGQVIARGCANAGATVVLHGRIVRKLEALYDEIQSSGAPQPLILPIDFLKAGAPECHAAATALDKELGRLDALVHTATLLGSLGPIEHQHFDRWLEVLRMNVAMPMALTRALLPALAKSSDASVTFTINARGVDPRAYWGAYAASHAALEALCTTLADEWENRPALRVNALVPGAVRSPLRTLTHPGEDKTALPVPDDFLPLYLYLLAGQSKQESAVRIDGASWRAGVGSAVTPLLNARDHP